MTALRDVQGIGPSLESQLHEAGYGTVADLAAADPNNLVAVRGIGPVSARQIIAAAADLTSGPRPDPSAPKSTPNAEKEPGGARKAKKKPKKKNKKKKAKNATAAKKSNTAKAKKTTKKKKKKKKRRRPSPRPTRSDGHPTRDPVRSPSCPRSAAERPPSLRGSRPLLPARVPDVDRRGHATRNPTAPD